jgi:hypothetical protein
MEAAEDDAERFAATFQIFLERMSQRGSIASRSRSLAERVHARPVLGVLQS